MLICIIVINTTRVQVLFFGVLLQLPCINPVHIRALSSKSSVDDKEDDAEESADSVKPRHQLPSVKVTKLAKDQTRYHLSGLLEGQGLKAKSIKIITGDVLDFNHAFVVCYSSRDAGQVAEFLNGRLIGRQKVTARVCGAEGLNANSCYVVVYTHLTHIQHCLALACALNSIAVAHNTTVCIIY